MRILLVGNGAREHALAWKIKNSPLCEKLYCTPLSPVTELLAESVSAELSSKDGFAGLLQLIREEKIDLLICGPEKPLAEGLADKIHAEEPSCQVIGPCQFAAGLEASKSFAKEVMKKAGIPTAHYELVSSVEEAARVGSRLIGESGGAVLKADGLAGGKGVFVCHNQEDLAEATKRLEGLFASGEKKVVVEEELLGREFSYFSLVNHKYHTPLGCAVDFKRLGEGDTGPNTGGMGAYSPVPWLPQGWESEMKEKIMDPLLDQLVADGISYRGFLYCGLMLTKEGIKVIEFNVRLGDPEAQVVLGNDSRDLVELCVSALEKKEGYTSCVSSSSKAVGVVLTSPDYPYPKKEGLLLEGALKEVLFKNDQSPYAFAASLHREGEAFYPQKGRVMTLVGKDLDSFEKAKAQVNQKIKEIGDSWEKAYYRKDIASKVIQEEARER